MRRRINRDIIICIIEEFSTRITFDIVGIIITPTKLNIDPILIGSRTIKGILLFMEKRRLADRPLEGSIKKNISTRRIHLVRFTRMDGFLLDSFNVQGFQFHIKDLTKIHNNRLVNLLPQVSTEDLNEGNLKSGNLTMHENTSQIELDLETNVNISSVDCR